MLAISIFTYLLGRNYPRSLLTSTSKNKRKSIAVKHHYPSSKTVEKHLNKATNRRERMFDSNTKYTHPVFP